MMYLLLQRWLFSHTEPDPDRAGVVYEFYFSEEYEFDSTTRQVVAHPYPYQQYQRYTGPDGDDAMPPGYSRDVAEEFYVYEPGGGVRTGYFHDGQGGVTTTTSALQLTVTVLGCDCFGQATGLIDVEVSGGVGPYAYAWSDGITTEDRTALPAGTYSLTVTDTGTGTTLTRTVTVGQNPRLTVLVRKTENNVRLEVSGGVGPYTYAWSDGATTAERLNLAPGAYTCLITDALGCTVETEFTIEGYRYYFSGNPITLSLDAGDAYRADPTTKPGLTFLCEVWLEPEFGSGTFEQVGTVLEQPADAQGRTVFEVQELLDAYLDYHVPAVGQDQVSLAAPLFRRFYLQYAENYGTPPVRSATTVLTQHVVLRGGLSGYEHVAQTYQDVFRPAVRPFLTWQPNQKPAAADQPEFLYLLVDEELTEFSVHVRRRFADGSSQVRQVAAVRGVARYQVYCLPAGYAQLGLADGADAPLVAWDVWVSGEDGEAQSETRTYVLDRRPVAQRRYLLYANSLGGMDTAAFTGEGQLDAEVKGEEIERAPGPFPDPLLSDQLVLDRTLRPVLKLASGLRADSRAWVAVLQELLLSRRVLLLSGGRWLPGTVKAATSTIRKDGEYAQTLDVTFQLPLERFYTPRLGAASPRPADLLPL